MIRGGFLGMAPRCHADDLVKVEHQRMAAGRFWVFEDEPDAEALCQHREPSRLYGEIIPKLDLLVLLAGKVGCR